MRTQSVVGAVLVVLGVVLLVFGRFSYTTTREAVKVGPVGITTQEEKTFAIPPVVGGVVLAAGVVLLIADRRRP